MTWHWHCSHAPSASRRPAPPTAGALPVEDPTIDGRDKPRSQAALAPLEVLAEGSIELRGFLEGDAVTGIIESQHFSVRNALRESIGLLGPNQDIFARADQERG